MEHAEIHEQMGDLREDFHRLRSDLNSILHTMMDATRSEAGEAKEKLEAKAREQLDQLAHAVSGARDQGREMAGKLCNQIETHPMASVLSALGAGFLIGILASRK